ncbi:MAG: GPW/gp25 family protein [Candidatus Izemoplasmatales bacterium]|jgi:phage baseplate assembly protein W
MAKSYSDKKIDSYLGFGWAEDPFTRVLYSSSNGDIASAGGVNNLANSIYRRLKTPLGWYPEFPWFGCRINEMIGMGNTYENRELISQWIQESLLYEKRIMDGTLHVSVTKDSSDYRAIRILVTCKIINFASPNAFVYDFFLKTGDLKQVGVQ